MSLIQRPYQLLSDLVVHEVDPCVGYARKVVDVTVSSNTTIKLGSVVFRAKGTDPTVAYSVVTDATSFVTTNEFAVVYGDQYAFKADFTPKAIAANKYNAIVTKRAAGLKEYYIKAVHATALGAGPYGILKQIMADQGLIVLDDVTNFTGVVV